MATASADAPRWSPMSARASGASGGSAGRRSTRRCSRSAPTPIATRWASPTISFRTRSRSASRTSACAPAIRIPEPEDIRDPRTGRRGIDNFASFMRFLAPPPAARSTRRRVGRAGVHARSAARLPRAGADDRTERQSAVQSRPVPLFSDLLLHDVGTGDGIRQARRTRGDPDASALGTAPPAAAAARRLGRDHRGRHRPPPRRSRTRASRATRPVQPRNAPRSSRSYARWQALRKTPVKSSIARDSFVAFAAILTPGPCCSSSARRNPIRTDTGSSSRRALRDFSKSIAESPTSSVCSGAALAEAIMTLRPAGIPACAGLRPSRPITSSNASRSRVPRECAPSASWACWSHGQTSAATHVSNDIGDTVGDARVIEEPLIVDLEEPFQRMRTFAAAGGPQGAADKQRRTLTHHPADLFFRERAGRPTPRSADSLNRRDRGASR